MFDLLPIFSTRPVNILCPAGWDQTMKTAEELGLVEAMPTSGWRKFTPSNGSSDLLEPPTTLPNSTIACMRLMQLYYHTSCLLPWH